MERYDGLVALQSDTKAYPNVESASAAIRKAPRATDNSVLYLLSFESARAIGNAPVSIKVVTRLVPIPEKTAPVARRLI